MSSTSTFKTPPSDSTQKLWSVVTWVAIGVISITLLALHTAKSTAKDFSISGESGETKILNISTSEWTLVETNGKEFESEILPIDGLKPKYFISINSTKHPIEQPSSKETKLGEAKDIHRIYYCLKASQEFNEASIKFKFK